MIEPTTPEWASTVVIVPKHDRLYQMCIDYRKLNAVTIRDTHRLLRMDEFIDSLGDATVFSTMDDKLEGLADAGNGRKRKRDDLQEPCWNILIRLSPLRAYKCTRSVSAYPGHNA